MDPTTIPADDLAALLSPLLHAFSTASGAVRWILAACAALVLAVYVVRKVGARVSWLRWTTTDEGGTLLNILLAGLGAVATKAVADGRLTWSGVLLAFGAAAGVGSWSWTTVRRLLRLLAPLIALVPGIGPSIATFIRAISGAQTPKEVIAKETDAAYKPVPDPSMDAVAKGLGAPPER